MKADEARKELATPVTRMRAQPTVSLCIPLRNGGSIVEHTLSNLLVHGTYPGALVEVLVGDHQSTDASRARVERWATRHSNVHVVDVPFRSPSRSFVRNRLLERASGEIVIFIDHDVLACHDFVSAHVQAHEERPGSLVAGRTLGKGFFRQDVEQLLTGIDLDDIGACEERLLRIPELEDLRMSSGAVCAESRCTDLSATLAPFRWFWTCNLSARRTDIDECGPFDEGYDRWGLEDDDFARRFQVAGRAMSFSLDAWAMHVPHPVDTFSNVVAWRHNFERFFRAHSAGDVELYGAYPTALELGVKKRDEILGMVRTRDVRAIASAAAPLLPAANGRRLCHFLPDADLADRLGVTDALDPFAVLGSGPRRVGATTFWPLIGFRTPFERGEIAQSLILEDVFVALDELTVTLLLAEVARISREVVFCVRHDDGAPHHQDAARSLSEAASRVRFNARTVLFSGTRA